MAITEERTGAAQKTIVVSGNHAAAEAIAQIGYDLQGFYPITPSSDVGEEIAAKIAKGDVDMVFVPATSELAAISVCTGAAAAGARCVDVTSSQGLLLKFEELPVISGIRLPMVMNIAARAISAPLNIKCDHSDIMQTLGTGWLTLFARNVQEVYDMNLVALKWAERANLPVFVVYDGFFTSHGTRRIRVFEDKKAVQDWIGPRPERATLLDVHNPKTFGPYMNEDLINSKYQLRLAMQDAAAVLPEIFAEFEKLSGRRYEIVDLYGMEDNPEVAMFLLASAADCAKDAVDQMRSEGKKVGVIAPRVIRPFPVEELAEAFGGVKVGFIGERADQFGGPAGFMTNEVATVLQARNMDTKLYTRVYGLGGNEFTHLEARDLFDQALKARAGEAVETFDYYGHWEGKRGKVVPHQFEPGPIASTYVNRDMPEKVNIKTLQTLATEMPIRVVHPQSCPGCGIFTNLEMFLHGIDGPVVLLFNTGCGMVVTTGYPNTSFRVPYMHNLFHNGASTASGVVETYLRFRKQGLIKDDVTVVCVGGDGSGDIGLDQILGAAIRNHPFIYLEYDNNVYANTGAQFCYTAPKGFATPTSPGGKNFHHKDMIELLRGTHAKYIATFAETHVEDALKKARKAQAMARAGNFSFVKCFSACPLNWQSPDDSGPVIVDAAVDSCFFPLLEVENGKTLLNYDPELTNKKIPVVGIYERLGKSGAHLRGPEHEKELAELQAEVDRRWRRLKAMHESPDL